ncbi:hypothetical protein Ahy_Scaffold1g106730 isoform B [Arachis hypogaea]|uniref:Transposase MuDR plant domain-containing protein n=1 Tax=Arachis hypogaea TaxID=3818 RepID=A0A444WRP7_ARAHY|nr:hypothetical protein Ahy_Scaffold1g106730 isoform B [Arachis hypogaea]
MRNNDNGVTFECENSILLRTQRVSMLSELKSLILSNFGGIEAREVRRIGYKLLANMGNRVFRFRQFRLLGDEHVRLMFDIHGRIMAEQVMELYAKVGDIGGGGSVHSTNVQDDRPLAPPPIHLAIPVDEAEEGDEELNEEYMANSANSDSSERGDEEEFVPETLAQTVAHHVLPPPHPIPTLSAVPSHYHSLDLDAMHERTPFSNTGEKDYNLDSGVEFRCRQAANGCQWSLCVALRQNFGYCEVRRVGGVYSCLELTMSQDHRQLDSSLICRIILLLIQSNSSISISVLQGVVWASYHFKPSYRKVWMAKKKAIAQIYRDWKESYNMVPKLLQALQ